MEFQLGDPQVHGMGSGTGLWNRKLVQGTEAQGWDLGPAVE